MHRYPLRENPVGTQKSWRKASLESHSEEQEFQEREKGDDASISIIVPSYDASLNYA